MEDDSYIEEMAIKYNISKDEVREAMTERDWDSVICNSESRN